MVSLFTSILFSIIVVVYDPVHDVLNIFHIGLLLTASGNFSGVHLEQSSFIQIVDMNRFYR